MQELGLHKIIARKSHLEEKRQELFGKREQLLRYFREATEQSHDRRMRYLCRRIQQTNEFLECLEQIKVEIAPQRLSGSRKYVVSSMFLYECYRDLTADASEQFFFVTGSEVDGCLVLDQKAEFSHQKRSVVGVIGDTRATHGLLIRLEKFGHRLLAHFHSHPGVGLGSTNPSGTDDNFQKRLERAGYPTVAAIFSRDGYVRFFRSDNDLEIQIHGKGIENLGHHSYRLTDVNNN
jgi:proteasome lid subunit RPN8/RPN11